MANALDLQVFKTICATLDKKGRSYHCDTGRLAVIVDGHTEDGTPYEIYAIVGAIVDDSTISIFVPFSEFPKEKLVEMALAITTTNTVLMDGRMNMKRSEYEIFYEINHYYGDVGISEKTVEYLFDLSDDTTQSFFQGFSYLVNGEINIYQFMEVVNST